jgi:hypothetical protein
MVCFVGGYNAPPEVCFVFKERLDRLCPAFGDLEVIAVVAATVGMAFDNQFPIGMVLC